MKFIKTIFSIAILFSVLVVPASAVNDLISIDSVGTNQNNTVNALVTVQNSSGVAGIQLNLLYDANVVLPIDASFNRTLWNLQASFDSVNATEGLVRITVAHTGEQAILTGDINIVNLTFRAVGVPRSNTTLALQVVDYSDDFANPISFTTQNGTFTIVPKGDVDGYAGITMADAMWIGKAAAGISGFPEDITTMDIDDDGDVTIEDARRVAQFVVGNRETL